MPAPSIRSALSCLFHTRNGARWPFGLKGRFCQPKPKAWVAVDQVQIGPVRAVRGGKVQANGPYRADDPEPVTTPRPSAWADRIGPSGRRQSRAAEVLGILVCILCVHPAKAQLQTVVSIDPKAAS